MVSQPVAKCGAWLTPARRVAGEHGLLEVSTYLQETTMTHPQDPTRDMNLDPILKEPGAHPIGTAVGAVVGAVLGGRSRQSHG